MSMEVDYIFNNVYQLTCLCTCKPRVSCFIFIQQHSITNLSGVSQTYFCCETLNLSENSHGPFLIVFNFRQRNHAIMIQKSNICYSDTFNHEDAEYVTKLERSETMWRDDRKINKTEYGKSGQTYKRRNRRRGKNGKGFIR